MTKRRNLPKIDQRIELDYPIIQRDYLRHKAPVIPPLADPDAPPLRCIAINREYVAFMLAVLDYYSYPDQFLGTDEEKELAALRFETLRVMLMLDGDGCGENSMFRLRQSTQYPCILEQSLDAGATWMKAFDYTLCTARRGTINITYNDMQTYNQQTETNFTTYNGDIVNNNAGWAYGDADDLYRDMAICWSLVHWVEICANLGIAAGNAAAEDRAKNWLMASWAVDTLGDFLAALADAKVWVQYTKIGAIIAEITAVGLRLAASFENYDPAALSDQAAQEAVQCAIFDVLQGSKPTFPLWKGALFEHGLVGNEGQIADLCYDFMQDEELYVNFLTVTGELVAVAKTVGDLPCPCNDYWQVLIDLKNEPLPDYVQVLHGAHYLGIGLIAAPYNLLGGWQMLAQIKLTPHTTGFSVTNVFLEYEAYVWGGGSGGIPAIDFTEAEYPPAAAWVIREWTHSVVPDGNGYKEDNVSASDLDQIAVVLRAAYAATPSGDAHMTKVRIRGSGVNPFI